MVLGETCRMAATSADRRKLAVLGAGRADWLCIGTSFDALGAGGASPPPAPTTSEPGSRAYAVSGDVVVPLLGRAERRKSIAGRLSRRPQSRLAAFWGGPSASPTRHSKAHRPSP